MFARFARLSTDLKYGASNLHGVANLKTITYRKDLVK